MDVPMVIKLRLDELGIDQRELARAADVTESYISQLLTRRRMPPAPHRTDIYEKMDRLLKLERGELAKLAAHQRVEQVKRELGEDAVPLFAEVRELILRKCHVARRREVRGIFEQQPFGELERLVTTTIVDVVKRIAREELENETWLRTIARIARRSYTEMRVATLEFLDTDMMQLSPENCVGFLDPVVKGWDIDLPSFAIEVSLNPKVSPVPATRYQFVERPAGRRAATEVGFADFLRDKSLSGSATREELDFLESLVFTTRRPTALYYYRELQNLRDPLHFRAPAARSSR